MALRSLSDPWFEMSLSDKSGHRATLVRRASVAIDP